MFGMFNLRIILRKVSGQHFLFLSPNSCPNYLKFIFYFVHSFQRKSTKRIWASPRRLEEFGKIEKVRRHSWHNSGIHWHRWEPIQINNKHQREYLCYRSPILQRLLPYFAWRKLEVLIKSSHRHFGWEHTPSAYLVKNFSIVLNEKKYFPFGLL